MRRTAGDIANRLLYRSRLYSRVTCVYSWYVHPKLPPLAARRDRASEPFRCAAKLRAWLWALKRYSPPYIRCRLTYPLSSDAFANYIPRRGLMPATFQNTLIAARHLTQLSYRSWGYVLSGKRHCFRKLLFFMKICRILLTDHTLQAASPSPALPCAAPLLFQYTVLFC